MKNSLKYIFFLLLIQTSCVKDVDFDQVSEFTLTPVFRSAFTYFTATPAKFYDSTGTIQQDTITDTGTIDFFQDQLIEESLVQLDFLVEASNQFNRDITISIRFLNPSNVPLYSLTPLLISSGELSFNNTEVINLTLNPQVFETTKIEITAAVEDTGSPLDPNDTSEFNFQSELVFYVEKSF